MKKFLSILLALCLMASLAACGGGGGETKAGGNGGGILLYIRRYLHFQRTYGSGRGS